MSKTIEKRSSRRITAAAIIKGRKPRLRSQRGALKHTIAIIVITKTNHHIMFLPFWVDHKHLYRKV